MQSQSAFDLSILFVAYTYIAYRRYSHSNYKSVHCDALGVQLTASVSIISSGLGFPGAPASPSADPTASTLSRTVYVDPGFKSSILACILLFLFLVTSFALIILLWPSVSHFYRCGDGDNC
jgi:hypothetical protein